MGKTLFLSGAVIYACALLLQTSHADSPKVIPAPKFSTFGMPTVKFLYWRVFEEFAQMIQQRYPGLNIEGDNYPPPALKQYVASFIGWAKFLVLALIGFGINPFTQLFNRPTPVWFQYALDNKMYICMMLFFVSNAIESQLYSTGAFEVHYNDLPVWSKLKTGRVPSPQELLQIIENHQQFRPDHT